MTTVFPICCDAAAFEFFAQQTGALDNTAALVRAAVAVALHAAVESGDAPDIEQVERTLDGYGKLVASRVRGTQTQAKLAHLHEYLFEEQGFAGNQEEYFDPANCYLPSVLESRLGVPITLTLIYKAVAERIGLNVAASVCRGISWPAWSRRKGRCTSTVSPLVA